MSIHVDSDGPVTVVTIDRPEVANAIDRPTAEALVDAFRAFDADDDAAVAVLTGANDTFCAGADLKAMREPGAPRASRVELRSDRASSYEQWSLDLDEALSNEYRHGIATLETGELFGGLDRYAAGEWRA